MNGATAVPKRIDTYAVYESFAKGGMASAHYGLHLRPGFSRPVALKRLHPTLAAEDGFVASFLEEARLAARVRHPNVVPTLDVVSAEGEVLLVMEYVAGEALSGLLRAAHQRKVSVPLPVTVAIVLGMLEGLHAAHEAVDEFGRPLHLVHRDVSPQNVLVGLDGVSRVLDFGIAKAATSLDTTREGQIKGKIAYMAPEQLTASGVASRGTDIYSAGVVLWEMLTVRRMFDGDGPPVITAKVSSGVIEPPSRYARVPPAVEAVVMRALQLDPRRRFASTREMARALEAAAGPASNVAVGAWVEELSGPVLRERSQRLSDIERAQASGMTPAPATVMTASIPPGAPSGTVSIAVPLRAPSSGAIAALGVAVLVMLALLVGVIVARRNAASSAPPLDEGVPSASLPTSPTSSGVLQSAMPSSVPSGEAVDPAPSATVHVVVVPSHGPIRRGNVRPPPSTPKTNPCDPPWIIDADGIRQYKKGCFLH